MRASVMLHLPALKLVNQVTHILGAVTKFGLAVRGCMVRAATQASIYQLSNQATLGMSEEGIIERLNRLTNQISKGNGRHGVSPKPSEPAATEDRYKIIWHPYQCPFHFWPSCHGTAVRWKLGVN